jgi:hypothetical protein
MTERPERRATFRALEQDAYRGLEQAAYLKGFLRPFKDKEALEGWANQCMALRDGLIALAERQVLPQAAAFPFSALNTQLASQPTAAGTTFLRWCNPARSRMGGELWERLIVQPTLSSALVDDLYAMEMQRIVFNMQVSLLHSIVRQAVDCVSKMARAEAAWHRRHQTFHNAPTDQLRRTTT